MRATGAACQQLVAHIHRSEMRQIQSISLPGIKRVIDRVLGRFEQSNKASKSLHDNTALSLEAKSWLDKNRLERMDATVDIFDAQRREFHLDRYRFAAQRTAGLRILDCACGTGYGVRLLVDRGDAAAAIGIDINHQSIDYARTHHTVDAATFICASGEALPIGNHSFDIITSFETIEHVPDDEKLVSEFYRVLKPGGLLIISTPNQWPLADAPFHVREYDRRSFLAVLNAHFECLEMYNQNSGSPSPFNRGQARGIIPTTAENEQVAECYLAVCCRR